MFIRMSVCLSVRLSGFGFSVAIKIEFQFFVQISLIYEHLFYNYFVRRSVGASLLMEVVILFYVFFLFLAF